MEDVLWAAWPLAQPSSGAEWTAHSFRKPGPKYSGGTPIQRPVQGRWPGTIQEPKCRDLTLVLPSSLGLHKLPVLYYLWILTFLLLSQRKKLPKFLNPEFVTPEAQRTHIAPHTPFVVKFSCQALPPKHDKHSGAGWPQCPTSTCLQMILKLILIYGIFFPENTQWFHQNFFKKNFQ